MAVAFRSSDEATANVTMGITITKPAGVVEGDALLIGLDVTNETGLASTGSLFVNLGFGPGGSTSVWYRRAGSSEPADYSFTTTFVAKWALVIAAFTGAVDENPTIATYTEEVANAPNCPSSPVAAESGDHMAWAIAGVHSVFVSNGETPDAPTGYTLTEWAHVTAGGGTDSGMVTAHKAFTGTSDDPGAFGQVTVSDEPWDKTTVLILEAAAAAGIPYGAVGILQRELLLLEV